MTPSKPLRYFFVLALLVFSGCEDFLEKQPLNQVSAETFYKTEKDAVAALTSAYDPLQWPNVYGLRIWMLEIAAGNSIVGAGGGTDGFETVQWSNFNTTTDNPGVSDLWNGHYAGVLRANVVIEKVPGIADLTDKRKAEIVGQAQFLRALYYFNLVRLFGKVPLITKPQVSGDDLRVSRAEVAAVYGQIIGDLTDAEAGLPVSWSGEDLGRATQGSAKALLAKVYLTQENWSLAAAKAEEVIDLGVYTLHPDYADNFNPGTENGAESIFEVQYQSGSNGWMQSSEGNVRSEFMAPRQSGITPWGGFGWNQPTEEFVSQYEPGDKRKAVTVFSDGDTYEPGGTYKNPDDGSRVYRYKKSISYTGHNVRKYLTGLVNSFGTDSPMNTPVLRYADVLLMHAEALNELGQTSLAESSLNQVRERAGLPPVSGLDKDAFREKVLHERRMELAFEGEWWFDLVRTGRAIPFLRSLGNPDPYGVARGNIQPKHLLFPIPQGERDINPSLSQNDGY